MNIYNTITRNYQIMNGKPIIKETSNFIVMTTKNIKN